MDTISHQPIFPQQSPWQFEQDPLEQDPLNPQSGLEVSRTSALPLIDQGIFTQPSTAGYSVTSFNPEIILPTDVGQWREINSNNEAVNSWSSTHNPLIGRSVFEPHVGLSGEPKLNSNQFLNQNSDSFTKEIVFIDGAIDNQQSLLADISPEIEVVQLDKQQNGIEQISDFLALHENVSAIHIFSHGSVGNIELGTTNLNSETLSQYQTQLQGWAKALTTEADILLYGCNVAAGEDGQAFVQQFAGLTGADIAASDDWTGNANLGGDWVLESESGTIEAHTLSSNHYSQTLGTVFVQDGTLKFLGGEAGTLKQNDHIVLSSPDQNTLQIQSLGISITILGSTPENITKVDDEIVKVNLDNIKAISIDTGANDDTIEVKGLNFASRQISLSLIGGQQDDTFIFTGKSVINGNVTINGDELNNIGGFNNGDDKVQIKGDIFTLGQNLVVNSEIIDITDNITISTRKLAANNAEGTDHLTLASSGNSGSIKLEGAKITIGQGGRLLAQSDTVSGFKGGDISLSVIDIYRTGSQEIEKFLNDVSLGITKSVNKAEIKIDSATIQGNNISLKSEVGGDTGRLDQQNLGSGLRSLVDLLVELPVAIKAKEAQSIIDITGSSQITSTEDLTIVSRAIADGSVSVKVTDGSKVTKKLAVGFSYAKAEAYTWIAQGVVIKSDRNVNILSDVTTKANATAAISQNLTGSEIDRKAKALTTSISYSKAISHIVVDQGATIEANGNANIKAIGLNDNLAASNSAIYEDGSVGIGLAFGVSDSDIKTEVNGTIKAKGSDKDAKVISLDDPTLTIDSTKNTLNFSSPHGFRNGDILIYHTGNPNNQPVGGLKNNYQYYVVVDNDRQIKLASDRFDAYKGIGIDIDANQKKGNGQRFTFSSKNTLTETNLSQTAGIGIVSNLTSKDVVNAGAGIIEPDFLNKATNVDLSAFIADGKDYAKGLLQKPQQLQRQTNISLSGAGIDSGSSDWSLTGTVAYSDSDHRVSTQVGKSEVNLDAAKFDNSKNFIELGYLHRFKTGDALVYRTGGTGNNVIGGLQNGFTYYAIIDGDRSNILRLATTADNAARKVAVDINASSKTGTGHLLERTRNADLQSQNDLDIKALHTSIVEIGASSEIEKVRGQDKKEYSVSAAVSIGNYDSNVQVKIGGGAALSASRLTQINAEILYPFAWDFSSGLLSAIPNPVTITTLDDAIAYGKSLSSLGNYVNKGKPWTSWTKSIAAADGIGVAGSVNILDFDNTAKVVVESGAAINQNQTLKTDQQSVLVMANTDMTLVNITGIPYKPIGGETGKGGVGGSVLVQNLNNKTIAQVEDNVKINTGNLGSFDLVARTDILNLGLTTAGGQGGNFGVSGSVMVNLQNNTTLAQLGSAALVTAGTVNIDALDDSDNWNLVGGLVKGGAVGIGISVAYNGIERKTQAVIGSLDTNASTRTQTNTIATNGDVKVQSKTTGSLVSASLAGAIASPGTTGTGGGSSSAAGGKYGIGISGSVSINKVADTTEAVVRNAKVSAKNLDVKASNDANLVAVSGALSLTLGAGKTGGGLAGSYSNNNLKGKTQAYVSNSEVELGDRLKVDILLDQDITAVGMSGTVSTATTGTLAGQVMINNIQNQSYAYIDANSTITTAKNIQIAAKDKSDIVAVAGAVSIDLGGKAGIGAAVALNTIKNETKAYIGKATLTNSGSLSVVAINNSKINSVAVSVAASKNMAASVAYANNDIANKTEAYVNNGAKITTTGTTTIKIPDAVTGSTKEEFVSGVAIAAINQAEIDNVAVNISGSEKLSVAGNVSNNDIKNVTKAYIDGSTVNSQQSVIVRGYSLADIDIKVGAVGISAKGAVGGSVDVTDIANQTEVYIQNSKVNASSDVEVTSFTREQVDAVVVSGGISGAFSAAGNVEILTLNSSNNAFINKSTVGASGNLKVTADNVVSVGENLEKDKDLNFNVKGKSSAVNAVAVGSIAASAGAGIGGTVLVTNITNTTTARITDSTTDAKKTTEVKANTKEIVSTLAGTAGIGKYAGIAGTAIVNLIETKTQAYINENSQQTNINKNSTYKTDDQILKVTANNDAKIDSFSGAIGAGIAGAGASVDVNNIGNKTEAFIGNGVEVGWTKNVDVTADAKKSVDSVAVAFSGGAVSVQGAIAITNLGRTTSDEGQNSLKVRDNEKKNESSQTFAGSLDNEITKAQKQSGNTSSLSESIARMFDPKANFQQFTKAYIGENTVIDATSIKVNATDKTYLDIDPGSAGVGIASLGGAAGIVNIRNDVQATVGSSSQLNATEAIAITSDSQILPLDAGNNSIIETRAGQAGGFALGGSVAIIRSENNATAYVGNQAQINQNRDLTSLTIKATTNNQLNANTGGLNVGGIAVGISNAEVYENGQTQAFVGNEAKIGSETHRLGTLKVQAETDQTVNAKSTSLSGGIVSGAGAKSVVSAAPTINAFMRDNALVYTNTDTTITAIAKGNLVSESKGVSVAAAAAGVSTARTDWNATVAAQIGKSVTLDSRGNVAIKADNQGNTIKSAASASGGGLIGGVGAKAETNVTSNTTAKVDDFAKVTADKNITIEAQSKNVTTSDAGGTSIGAAAVGSADSKVNVNNTTQAFTGDAVNLRSTEGNITIFSQSDNRNETVRAKATSGGIFAESGTNADSTINNFTQAFLGSGNSVNATNQSAGEFQIKAISFNQVKADSEQSSTSAIGFTNKANSYVTVNSNTNANIIGSSNIGVKTLRLLSETQDFDIFANSKSTVKALYSDDAQARAEVRDAKIYSNSDIGGRTNIKATTIELTATQSGKSQAKAEVDAAGAGSDEAHTANNLIANAKASTQGSVAIKADKINTQATSNDLTLKQADEKSSGKVSNNNAYYLQDPRDEDKTSKNDEFRSGSGSWKATLALNHIERNLDNAVVNTLTDELDGIKDNEISLREALLAVKDGGKITFADELFYPPNQGIINLDKNLGQLQIWNSLTIDAGENRQVILQQSSLDNQVLRVDDFSDQTSATVVLKGFKITGAGAGNASERGRGIYNAETLTLDHVEIAGITRFGKKVFNQYQGGGIFNTGDLTINNSSISGSSAEYGGGIFNTGNLIINDSNIDNNSAKFGGGIYQSKGTLFIRRSVYNDLDGGIYLDKQSTGKVYISLNEGSSPNLQMGDIIISNAGSAPNKLTLSGPDASKFDLKDSQLRLKPGVSFDYETQKQAQVTILEDDSDVGNSPNTRFSLTFNIIDVNEPPQLEFRQIITSISEGVTERLKIADIVIIDDALGDNYLELLGDTKKAFEIENNQLFLKSGLLINYEDLTTHFLLKGTLVLADRKLGLFSETRNEFQVNVTDVNEAPSLSLKNVYPGIPEKITSRLKIADIEIKDDALGENRLTLTGIDVAKFEIDQNQLFLKANTAIDYKTQTQLQVNVEVDDSSVGKTPDDSASLSFKVNKNIIVDTNNDENNGNYEAGDLSLREALSLTDAGGMILFSEKLANKTITLTQGSLLINKYLFINGDNYNITISGNKKSRIFTVDDGNNDKFINVILQGLTFTEGFDTSGGAIFSQENLNLQKITVSGNKSYTFTGYGGGISQNNGILSIINSTIAGNSSTGVGGGIFQKNGTLSIINSTIAGNYAGTNDYYGSSYGGGIYQSEGTLNIMNSTVSGNVGAEGGGIQQYFVTSNIIHSTIVDNYAHRKVAGINVIGGKVNLNNTIVGNRGKEFNNLGSVKTTGINLVKDGSLNGAGIINEDPKLGLLVNNGGFTLTHALLVGSPAINASDTGLKTDQRGFARPVGGKYDIGAFETSEERFKNVITKLAEDTDTSVRVKVADINTTDTLRLTGADANKFELNGNELFLKARTSLDYETQSNLEVTIEVDSGTPNDRVPLTIAVTDVNEAPSLSLKQAVSLIGEGTTSRIKVADITIKDDALGEDNNTLKLVGADADKFELEGNQLFLKGGITLNYKTQKKLQITITVDDKSVGNTPDASVDLTLSLVSIQLIVNTFAEDQNTSVRVKVADIETTDTLRLVGADANKFELDGNQLFLKAGTSLDYETQPKLQVNVESDNSNASDRLPFTITNIAITDVNEPPSVILKPTATTVVVKGTTSRMKVADIAIKDDALGKNNNTLSLVGSDADKFELEGNQLFLKSGITINLEALKELQVTVVIDDPTIGNTPDASAAVTLSLLSDRLVVDTLDDKNDGDYGVNKLSLREAISLLPSGGKITFSDKLIGKTIALINGELVIDKSLTIDGDLNDDGTPDIAINAQGNSRVFKVDDGDFYNKNTANFNLIGLIIQNGKADQGAGILLNYETLNISHSILSNNNAQAGGGIYNQRGTLNVSHTTLSQNNAQEGGGTNLSPKSKSIFESITFSANKAEFGGGIYQGALATSDITNSTFSGNEATSVGGGLYANGIINITNTTLSENKAKTGGGIGLYGNLTLSNSIIANSEGEDLFFNRDEPKTIGTNLIEDGSLKGTNIINQDPLLAPLSNNGGFTQTHALLPGSPAIDASNTGTKTDQRGFARPIGNKYDIGAFELQKKIQNNEPPSVNLKSTVNIISPGTTVRTKVAEITINDDALGNNTLSLSGTDKDKFEFSPDNKELFLKQGLVLNHQTQQKLEVIVTVDDPTVGNSPDYSVPLVIPIENKEFYYHFDVSKVLNFDAIVNHTEGQTDKTQSAIDDNNHALITQSFATLTLEKNGKGLPDNGFFAANSFHPDIQLSYNNNDNGNNAVLLKGTDQFTFAVPPRKYKAVHIPLTSTNGKSNILLFFNYSDGTNSNANIQTIPDWFDEIKETDKLYYLIDGMDRSKANGKDYNDSNDPALFGAMFTPDSTKTVTSIKIVNNSKSSNLVFLGGTGLVAMI